MSERVARSRELVARGAKPAVAARVLQISRQAIYRSHGFEDVRFVVGSLTVGRKVMSNTLADRIRNRYVLGVKTAFWLGSTALKKNRALLPENVERWGRRVLRAIQ